MYRKNLQAIIAALLAASIVCFVAIFIFQLKVSHDTNKAIDDLSTLTE
jgi:hypothetical protein